MDRPLLGYDWIAGMIDVESRQTPGVMSARQNLQDISEAKLEELTEFRSMNRQDCSGLIAPWREPAFSPISVKKRVNISFLNLCKCCVFLTRVLNSIVFTRKA